MELLITLVGAVLAIGGCMLRRSYRLRDFDEIRKMNARSDARRFVERD